MWNGAVFMPLIEEIETIEPGRPCAFNSAATAWLMKNIVSRFWVNSARQSARLTRVDGIQVEGAAPPATFTSPYRSPFVCRACSITAAMPSSVAASAATGTTGRPSATRGSICLSRFSVRAAHRDHGRPGAGDHPRHRRADAAAACAGDDDDAPVKAEEVVSHHPSCSLPSRGDPSTPERPALQGFA